MNQIELENRLMLFSVSLIKLGEDLVNSFAAQHFYKRLVISKTSYSLNYVEACGAEPKRDFINKLDASIIKTKVMKTIMFYLLTFISAISFSQNKNLTIGFQNSGLCFGNSISTNGLRLNFNDEDVNKVNGINISGLSEAAKINGISIGVLAEHSIAINGMSIGGLATECRKLNGIGIAGFGIHADTANGIFISATGVKNTNGTKTEKINGISAGIFCGAIAKKMNGLTLALVQNYVDNHFGVMIAPVNHSKNLHGIQFGLLNFAGNNRKLFRYIPILNFNFRKNNSR